jgi:hypothetical protein
VSTLPPKPPPVGAADELEPVQRLLQVRGDDAE